MSTKARLVTVAASALACLSITGCSFGASTLNTDNLAPAIEEVVGVPVTVECPEDIPIQQGLVTDCMVSDGTQTKGLRVTQTDDQGNVDWEITE
jgi:hypothetical protein